MTTDASDSLNNARNAISRGDKKTAQQILARIINNDSRNPEAWMLLSDILDDPELRVASLKRVLQINPKNIVAQRRLDELKVTHIQKDNTGQVTSGNASNTSTITPTSAKKTSPMKLGLMVLVAILTVIIVVVVASFGGRSNQLPPHTVNDLQDSGNMVDYYIVVDKSLSKEDAMKLIDYYQGQHSGYGILNIELFCDSTYAAESFTISTVPENEIYAHMLYWYQTGSPGTKFLNDITNPDLANYPTLGSACK